jgi:hypothetical protein
MLTAFVFPSLGLSTSEVMLLQSRMGQAALSCTGPVTSSFDVLGTESVTVPAGTFNNAVKLTSTTAGTAICTDGTKQGYGSGNSTDAFWIVPGFGGVKSLSSAGVPAQLVSYTIK